MFKKRRLKQWKWNSLKFARLQRCERGNNKTGTNILMYTGMRPVLKIKKKIFQQKLVRMLLMEHIMEFELYMYIYLSLLLDHMYI